MSEGRPAGQSLEELARGLPSWAVVGILAVVGGLFLPTLRFGFVYDDHWTLVANGFLREPAWGALLDARGAEMNVVDAFRPTSVAFDVLTYRLVGLSAATHHGISIALHLAVCALLGWWIRVMGASRALQLATVALFGVMGIHAEPVAMISFREDLLAAALALAAAVAGSLALRNPRRTTGGLVVAVVAMALASGAKLSAATMPLAWAVVESWSPFERSRAVSRRGLVVAVATAMLLGVGLALAQRWAVFGSFSPYDAANNPRVLASRVGTGPVLAASALIHLDYARQMLLPVGLSPEYADFSAAWDDVAVRVAMVALATGFGAAMFGARKRPLLGAVVLGTVVLALPTANLVGLPNMRADRYMYLPSTLVAVGLAAALLDLGQRRMPRAPVAPLMVMIIAQGSLAIAASAVYRSNTTLWGQAVRKAPDSARAQAMAGLQRLESTGDLDAEAVQLEARARCRRAERLDPDYELVHLCHARVDVAQRRTAAALERLERALDLSPNRNSRIYAVLAQVARDLPGDAHVARARSAAWLEEGLHKYPFSSDLHAVAGRLAHREGHAEAARRHYARARSLRPERSEIVAWQVELDLDLGQIPRAFETWRREARVLARLAPPERDRLRRRLRLAHRWQEDRP